MTKPKRENRNEAYMGLLNRYLLKNATIYIIGLIVFAVCVFMLERLLRIFQAVSNSPTPGQDATTMIANLMPYYLSMAIPIALMLGIIFTVDRFSRSSELTAALGAGISLFHMSKPFIFLAILFSLIALFVESIAIPKGRYQYRETLSLVKQQSYAAVLRQGTFATVGDRTVFAGTEREGTAIGPVFIYEKLNQSDEGFGIRVTTASEGQLVINQETREVVIQLADGKTREITPQKSLEGDFEFGSSDFRTVATVKPFRARGDDEREMTSGELMRNYDGAINAEVDRNTTAAALHIRIAKSVLLLIIPFIAVPFGLNYGRNPSSAGIIFGIIFLVSLQKALEFAQSLGAKGAIPPWLGIWSIMAIVAALAFYIYRKSAFKMGQPPLTAFGYLLKDLFNWFRRDIKETGDVLKQSTTG